MAIAVAFSDEVSEKGERTQELISQLLEEALKCLEEKDSGTSLNRGAFKIALTSCRHVQSDNQKMRLPIGI